jgi:hypothetical protein
VSTDGLLPLDSLLAAEWIRRNYPEQFYSDGAKGTLIEPQLPLAEVQIGEVSIWAASVAQYHLYGEQTYYWHKRFDERLAGMMLDRPRRVNTGSGEFKGYRMPVNVLMVSDLTWFAVGDLDAVRDLLTGIRALGKKRAYGFGAVTLDDRGQPTWAVEPWPDDWSIRGPGGRLMRSVPWDGQHSGTVRRWGVRPPGWLPANQVIAEIPKVGDWDELAHGRR